MPALPVAPDTIRLGVTWNDDEGRVAFNRLFFSYSGGPPSAGTLDTMSQDIYTSAVTNLIPLASADWALESISMADLATDTGAVGEYVHSTAGTRSGTTLGADSAVMVNYKIVRRYRGGKPRTYYPFGVGGDLGTPGQWSSGAISSFGDGIGPWLLYIKSLTVAGCSLGAQVNVSYHQGFTAVTNPITGRTRDVPNVRATAVIDAIVASSVNPNVATQRRRTGIRGG